MVRAVGRSALALALGDDHPGGACNSICIFRQMLPLSRKYQKGQQSARNLTLMFASFIALSIFGVVAEHRDCRVSAVLDLSSGDRRLFAAGILSADEGERRFKAAHSSQWACRNRWATKPSITLNGPAVEALWRTLLHSILNRRKNPKSIGS